MLAAGGNTRYIELGRKDIIILSFSFGNDILMRLCIIRAKVIQ